jgi:hypothetical protein
MEDEHGHVTVDRQRAMPREMRIHPASILLIALAGLLAIMGIVSMLATS